MVLDYIKDMYSYIVISTPIIVFMRLKHLKRARINGIAINIFHEFGITAFILFLIGLASQTVLPDSNFSVENIKLNLTPFKIIRQTYHTILIYHSFDYFFVNLIGNIAIFMPIGFFIPMLWYKKHIYLFTILVGFSISVSIETVQLFLPRSTDIDDVILNTFGTALGCFIFALFNRFIPKFFDRFK